MSEKNINELRKNLRKAEKAYADALRKLFLANGMEHQSSSGLYQFGSGGVMCMATASVLLNDLKH